MEYTKIGRVRPAHVGTWSSGVAYTALEMVNDSEGKLTYIARKDVPAGTMLTNTNYWAVVLDVSEVVDAAKDATNTLNNIVDEKANSLVVKTSDNPTVIYPDDNSAIKPVLRFGPGMAGSGTPSRSNIRKMYGHKGAVVSCSKTNLANTTFAHGTRALNGTLSLYNEGSTEQCIAYADLVPVAPRMTLYAASENMSFVQVRYYFYNSKKELIMTDIGNPTTGIVVPDYAAYFALQKSEYADYADYIGDKIIVSNEPISSFEAYEGKVASVSFDNTIYGGVVDWNAKTLVINRGYLELTGDEIDGMTSASGGTADVVAWIVGDYQSKISGGDFQIGECSHFKNTGAKDIDTIRFGAPTGLHTIYFYLSSSDFATVDAFRQYAANLYANGNPIQISYPLLNPITVSLNVDQLIALSGSNKVCASSESVEIEYNKSISKAFEEVLAELATLKASI